MPVDRPEYSVAFQTADLLQKDIGGRLLCPIYRDDALVVPSAATLTLKKPDGIVLLTGSGTIVSSIAGYTVTAGNLSAEDYQMGYRAEWTLTISGADFSFRNEVGVVRFAPAIPLSDRDLRARHTDLDRYLGNTGETSWQKWIDESWYQLQRWLIQKGNRPQLIVQSTDLKDLATAWAMVVIFGDLATNVSENDRVYRLRNEYREELERLKKEVNLQYSTTDESIPDVRRRNTSPVTMLGTSGLGDGYGTSDWYRRNR